MLIAGDGGVDLAGLDQGDYFLLCSGDFREVDAREAVDVIIEVLQLARVEVLDFTQAVGEFLLLNAVGLAQAAQTGCGLAVLPRVAFFGIGVIEVLEALEAVGAAHHDAESIVWAEVPLLQGILIENFVAFLFDAAHVDVLAGIKREEFQRELTVGIGYGALRRIDAHLDARQRRLGPFFIVFPHNSMLKYLPGRH